jgi:hypothetical protein
MRKLFGNLEFTLNGLHCYQIRGRATSLQIRGRHHCDDLFTSFAEKISYGRAVNGEIVDRLDETKQLMDCMYRRRQEPEYWFMTAQTLRRSAELLFGQIESRYPDGEPVNIEDVQMQLDKPAMLLLGLAFENTVKGHLLLRQMVTWQDASEKPAWKRHDLVKLYQLTGYKLTSEECCLLTHLSAFTVWAGKYPLSFKREDFAIDAEYSQFTTVPKLPPFAFDVFDRSKIDKLMKQLEEACR